MGTDDWMLPPSQPESEVDRRWNIAPPPQRSLADAYRMGGLAGMDKYRMQDVPHEVFGAYDRERALAAKDEALLAKAQSRTLSANPFANLTDQTPMVALTPEGRAKDRRDINTFGSMVLPSTPLDVLTMFTPWRTAKGALAGITTALSGHDEAEAGMTPRQAKALRKARAMGEVTSIENYNPRAVIGGNMPPAEMRLSPDIPASMANAPMGEIAATVPPIAAMTPKQAEAAWMKALPRAQPAARSTEIPDIRGLSVQEAIDLARTQPHLIKSGERGEGLYVGGPRDIQSKAALNKTRREFDAYLGADPRGADWYDRYRVGLNEITGGNKRYNDWASKQHGQWSAGVDPGSEAHFVLKENNAALMGMPVKAARPAQHEAFNRAIAANDPNQLQLGDKTWEYATKVTPDQAGPAGATGVNDFRHARNFNYTEKSGEPQKGALGSAGHTFLDYETALAVDRANRTNLGGRSDWTGEKLQAAPWVRQKALDLMSRNPNLTYDEAFARANTTLADYLPRMTYSATHEQQPGKNTGHMMGSIAAPQAEKDAFARDSRSNWATAPGGRDAIYSGLQLGDTGVAGRVRPSIPMQGYYQNPDGTIEANIGQVARPLGTFNTPQAKGDPFKRATEADQAMLNAGEAYRAWHDAQNAGSWHKLWFGGPAGESNTLAFPRQGMGSLADMRTIQGAATKYGLPDVVDRGEGIASTRFWPPPEGSKELNAALRKSEFEKLGLGAPVRARMDSNLIEYVDEWQKGEGSGEATRKMLGYITRTPEIKAAFNDNPFLADQALMKLDRDKAWSARWGVQRQDIQNAREIVAAGKGWVDRIEAALRDGSISLPAVAAMFAAASAQQEGPGRGE